jgi:predicted PurR-regulated permease PerM
MVALLLKLVLSPVVRTLASWRVPEAVGPALVLAGMLLAVPLLAATKIICDHVRPLNPIGEFLGQ